MRREFPWALVSCLALVPAVLSCSGRTGIVGDADPHDAAPDPIDIQPEEAVEDPEAEFVPDCLEDSGNLALASPPLLVSRAGCSLHYPRLLWTGSGFELVWLAVYDAPDYEAYLEHASVEADGSAVSGVTRVSLPMTKAEKHEAAWSGSEVGLVWVDSGQCFFGRIAAGGGPVGEPLAFSDQVCPPGECPYEEDPSIAWSGSEFGMAWISSIPGLPSHVAFTRVGPDGIEAGDDAVIGSATDGGEPLDGLLLPDIVWLGSEYLASWTGRDVEVGAWNVDVILQRLAPDGATTGAPMMLPTYSGEAQTSVLYSSGATIWIAWYEWDAGLYLSMKEPDGSTVSLLHIPEYGWPDNHPIVEMAWSGRYLAVASDRFTEEERATIIRVDSVTREMAGAPLVLGSFEGVESQNPDIEWTGSEYGVAWSETVPGTEEGRVIYFAMFAVCP